MSAESRTVLFMDKKLASPFLKEPRGVEVFNLNLIRELSQLGCAVTLIAHPSWSPVFAKWFGDAPVEVIHPVRSCGTLLGTAAAVVSLRARRFSVLLLGNVANRLIPALHTVRWLGLAPSCTVIAHRTPTLRCLRAQKPWASRIVCVNERIAEPFREAGFPDVAVYYGVTDADRFLPREDHKPPGVVDFCVMGHLDNAWKGSDTVVAAMRAFPKEAANGMRLHLASFHDVPSFPETNIIAYPWMPFSRMPSFLRDMDVMVTPSRDEGGCMETFCQAMVQGMLTGLPIIASDLPVFREKLNEGGGLIFRNDGELREAILKLAGDADVRDAMGQRAREIALARYVWNTEAFAHDDLFTPGRRPLRA